VRDCTISPTLYVMETSERHSVRLGDRGTCVTPTDVQTRDVVLGDEIVLCPRCVQYLIGDLDQLMDEQRAGHLHLVRRAFESAPPPLP
jgi:hypothetical protein